MKNKTLPLVIILFTLGILAIYILYIFSNKINHSPNHFIRLFRPHAIISVKPLDLNNPSYYLAGHSGYHVYLGNSRLPFQIIETNEWLTERKFISLSLFPDTTLRLQTLKLKIDSPYFFITDGNAPVILRGSLSGLPARRFMYDSVFYSLAIPIGNNSFALRITKLHTENYALAKLQNGSPHLQIANQLLTNQGDGLFSTDGMLLHNESNNTILYIYYYRNQFICMDSSLNKLYNGRTIDTVSWAKLSLSRTNNNHTIILAAPPPLINRSSATAGNLLFINSILKADNENDLEFRKASVIDLYNLRTGKYRFSLYIFDHGKKKMKDFAICGNAIIALFDQFLVSYQLDPQILQEN